MPISSTRNPVAIMGGKIGFGPTRVRSSFDMKPTMHGLMASKLSSSVISVLFNHVFRILIVSQTNELRMPEPICLCPLQVFYLGDSLRAKPDAFLHFLGSQFVAPTRFVRVRQIDKGHCWGCEMADFLEDLTT